MEQIVDYYQVLDISRGASPSEVQKAFRRQLLRWHPDKNQSADAKEKTITIIEAREILGDPEKRAEYDRCLISVLEKNPKLSQRMRKWRDRAQETAKANAQKPLSYFLKKAGLRTGKWLTGFILGISFLVLVLWAVWSLTNILAPSGEGFPLWRTALVFWGSALIIWLGGIYLFTVFKKRLFFFKCSHCGKRVETVHVCPRCGECGCFSCIGRPLKLELDINWSPSYLCNDCGVPLEQLESKRLKKFEQWVS